MQGHTARGDFVFYLFPKEKKKAPSPLSCPLRIRNHFSRVFGRSVGRAMKRKERKDMYIHIYIGSDKYLNIAMN